MADAKKTAGEVIQKMRAIAAEEPLTPLQADEELRAAGVDVDGFTQRLLVKVKKARDDVRLQKLRTAQMERERGQSVVRTHRYAELSRSALLEQVKNRGLVEAAYFNKLSGDTTEEDLRTLLEDDDSSKDDDKSEP